MSYHLKKIRDLQDKYISSIEFTQNSPKPRRGKRKQYISIGDLHAPFMRLDLVEEIISSHSGADGIVLTGDLFDNYSISKFKKRKEIPFIDEYRIIGTLVDLLSREFGEVILIDGNHEKRLEALVAKLDPTVQFLFKGSPLAYIARGHRFNLASKELPPVNLPNVIYAGDVNKASHWYKLGKAIFAHRLRGYKKVAMGNSTHIADWFTDRGYNYEVLVVPHTHHFGRIPYKGKLLIEQGCLCYPMEYEEDGSFTRRHQELGYSVIEMDKDGEIDRTRTHAVYLGTYTEEQS